jgi:hypothetical protein
MNKKSKRSPLLRPPKPKLPAAEKLAALKARQARLSQPVGDGNSYLAENHGKDANTGAASAAKGGN